MLNGIKAFIIFVLFAPAIATAMNLSGKWTADDGGTYYLRHVGNNLYWYGEAKKSNPNWANVLDGKVVNNRIKGDWVDVPKGKTNSRGKLKLDIKANGNILVATEKTGGFGGSKWTRDGYKPPLQVAPGVVGAGVVAVPLQPAVKEDCISFNPNTATVANKQGRWKIVDGSHWVFDFNNNEQEARRALKIIKHYKMNQSCYVGRPGPSFEYLLKSGNAPQGSISNEDCTSFNNANAKAKNVGGRWKIVDGNHAMFDFGNNKSEAQQALAIIKKHGFKRSCFVGRPGPSFKYLRR